MRPDIMRLGTALRILGFLAAVAPAAVPSPGHATSTCTLAGTTLNFGSIDIVAGPATASGTAVLTCTNTVPISRVYACLSLGVGTGGINASNRTLLGAATAGHIPITITSPPLTSSDIGDGTVNPMAGPFQLQVQPHNTGTYNLSLVANIAQVVASPAKDAYSSVFAGADATVIYTDTATPASCAVLAAGAHSSAAMTMTISADIPSTCSVSAGNLNFGTASVLNHSVSASAPITVTCNGTAATIALDNGATGTSPTNRLMRSGGSSISYGIYMDAAGSLPWGSTAGVNTKTATVSGSTTFTAYGIVPSQPTPPPGAYADVVNITVNY